MIPLPNRIMPAYSTPMLSGAGLIEMQKEIEEELNDHLALPEKRNSVGELSRDCELLYKFLDSPAAEKSKLETLYKFLHRLTSKLDYFQQGEVYLRAAPHFTFINSEGEVKFEAVWIYARLLRLSETYPVLEIK